MTPHEILGWFVFAIGAGALIGAKLLLDKAVKVMANASAEYQKAIIEKRETNAMLQAEIDSWEEPSKEP